MKITYWTTASLEPDIEAVSKEIIDLSNNFGKGLVVGVNRYSAFRYTKKDNVVEFNYKFDPLLRLIIPFIESRTDINHVYSEISPWIFYKTLKRKPIVITIASEKGDPVVEFLVRCRRIIVQTERMKNVLYDYAIERTKIDLIYPGVNLKGFKVGRKSPSFSRIRILFATLPRTEEELEARGVFFMIEAAKHCPEIEFRFMFRPWRTKSTSLHATEKLLMKSEIRNVQLSDSFVKNVGEVYKDHHFTVIPYEKADGGKECPRSLIESLACGIPVLISDVAPFAEFVAEHNCGCVFPLHYRGFNLAVEEGLKKYQELKLQARRCAEEYFDQKKTFEKYGRIYRELN